MQSSKSKENIEKNDIGFFAPAESTDLNLTFGLLPQSAGGTIP
jgi:hypothetical protein